MMKSLRNKMFSTIFLVFTGLQTIIGLMQIMADPSEEKNVFLFGYSFSRLLMAAVFLIILLLCIALVASNHTHKRHFELFVNRVVDHPKNFLQTFIILLAITIINAILIVISHNLNTNGKTIRFSLFSVEALILNILPLFSRLKLYLLKLIPFFKWCLSFGIITIFYLFWVYVLENQTPDSGQPKRYQKILFNALFVLLCFVVVVLIYFPVAQSLFLRIDTLYDWLLIFTLTASIGLLISILYYSKQSLYGFIWGLLIIGLVFNLIDHTYTSNRLELARKSSNSLESFLVPSNPHYHFREYPVYQKLSQDYAGKELIISENLLEDSSLSTTRLIAFGRLSRVTLTQDNTVVSNEVTNQLLKLPYSEISILDRYRAETNKWIFIEEGLVDAEKIYIKTTPQNDILVYPAIENSFLESSVQ